MVSARPSQSNWLANNALTIVLAIVALQNVWNTFNNEANRQIATLVERVNGLERSVNEGRARRDVQIGELSARLRDLEGSRR